jgi:hypothetical protein
MMVKKIFGYMQRTINSLTKDEDVRQELWLYLLEGNSVFTLIEYFRKITFKQNKRNEDGTKKMP